MQYKVSASEKFRIWRKRTGVQYKDIVEVMGSSISDNAVSMWMQGITKPKSYHRKILFFLSKELAIEGKYRMVLAANDWLTPSLSEELFVGEILRLWRDRQKMPIRQLELLTKVSITKLSQIENGELPSRRIGGILERVTNGAVKDIWWEKEFEEKDFM